MRGTRTTLVAGLAAIAVVTGTGCRASDIDLSAPTAPSVQAADFHPATSGEPTGSALEALNQLPVKGRAPKTGYSRAQFGKAWTDANTAMWGGDSLSTRENILSRDLTNIVCKVKRSAPVLPPCVVQSGVLVDPYTGATVNFVRGQQSSQLVPVDHVVALGDAWQKGAQQLSLAERVNLANDPLNLIATTQAPNAAKADADAASWVPNRGFRCRYVSRQVAVKTRYRLWVTKAEKDAIARVLKTCADQSLPSDVEARSQTR